MQALNKVDSKHSVDSTYSLGSLYSPFYHCHCFSLHIAASGYKPHPVPCVAAQKKAKQRFSAQQTLQLRPIYLVQSIQGRRQEFEEGGAELLEKLLGAERRNFPLTGSHTP